MRPINRIPSEGWMVGDNMSNNNGDNDDNDGNEMYDGQSG